MKSIFTLILLVCISKNIFSFDYDELMQTYVFNKGFNDVGLNCTDLIIPDVTSSRLDFIQQYIKNGNINMQDYDGNTALIHAVLHEKEDIVNLFINAKADLNIKNNNGYTALMVAVSEGKQNIVKLLVNASANQ